MITRRLSSTLPDVEFIYAMTPPELARYVLDDLNEQVNVKIGGGKENNFNLRDYIGLMRQHGTPYPGEEDRRLDMAIGEAWGWMLANGILLPNPWYPNAGYHCVTRVGLEVKTAEDFEGLRRRHAPEVPCACLSGC